MQPPTHLAYDNATVCSNDNRELFDATVNQFGINCERLAVVVSTVVNYPCHLTVVDETRPSKAPTSEYFFGPCRLMLYSCFSVTEMLSLADI